MIKLFQELLQEQVELSIKRAVTPLAPYLLKLAAGMAAYALAAFTFACSLLFLAVSLFFQLTENLQAYSQPALFVALAGLVLAGCWLLLAKFNLRKPR